MKKNSKPIFSIAINKGYKTIKNDIEFDIKSDLRDCSQAFFFFGFCCYFIF